MLEFIAVSALSVVVLLLALGALIALPLVLLAGLVKLVLFVVVLPFRLFGTVAGASFTVLGALAKVGAVLGAVLLGVLLLVGGLALVPVLALLLIGAFVGLAFRALRPRPAAG